MSEFLKLNWNDLGKGALVAFLTVFVGSLIEALNAGALPSLTQLGAWAIPALASGLGYLLKNLFQNSENKIGPEVPVE